VGKRGEMSDELGQVTARGRAVASVESSRPVTRRRTAQRGVSSTSMKWAAQDADADAEAAAQLGSDPAQQSAGTAASAAPALANGDQRRWWHSQTRAVRRRQLRTAAVGFGLPLKACGSRAGRHVARQVCDAARQVARHQPLLH
jgi:hypothetical protein